MNEPEATNDDPSNKILTAILARRDKLFETLDLLVCSGIVRVFRSVRIRGFTAGGCV